VIRRATPLQIGFCGILVVSLEDLAARAARLTLPLAGGHPVLFKHASDFLRLADAVHPADVERAWPEHRRNNDPDTFQQAATLLRELIPRHSSLLTTEVYSQHPSEHCARCFAVEGLELASGAAILSILGYC